MDDSERLLELLANITQQLPSLLTLLGCVVVALIRWKRHPKVSLVLAGSLLFLFAHILVFATAFVWLLELLINRGVFERYSAQTIYTAMSLTYNAGLAIGFALLLTSIFMQRQASSAGNKSGHVSSQGRNGDGFFIFQCIPSAVADDPDRFVWDSDRSGSLEGSPKSVAPNFTKSGFALGAVCRVYDRILPCFDVVRT